MNKFILALAMNTLFSLGYYLSAQKTSFEKIYFKSDSSNLSVEAEYKLKNISGVEEAKVEVVFEPPWDRNMMSGEGKDEK